MSTDWLGEVRHQREVRFRLRPELRIRTYDQARDWIKHVTVALAVPVAKTPAGLPLPSLLGAVRGHERSLGWDEETEMMWSWKDRLPADRHAWYGAYVAGRPTLIAADALAAFVSQRQYPDGASAYRSGVLSQAAWQAYEMLRQDGPMGRVALRRAVGLAGPTNKVRFERAITELETGLFVSRVGTLQEGAGWPSTCYATMESAWPDQSRPAIPDHDLRRDLLLRLIQSLFACTVEELAYLLRVPRLAVEAALGTLEREGLAHRHATWWRATLPRSQLGQRSRPGHVSQSG
jgi:hypothetical protein